MALRQDIGSTFHFSAQFRLAGALTRGERFQSDPALRERSVLVVTTNQTHLSLLTELLAEWGMRPLGAESAGRALEIVKGNPSEAPRLALIDATLGADDGMELIAELTTIEPSMKMVSLVGSTQYGQDARRAHAVGAAACLSKPLAYGEVIAALGAMINGAIPSRTEPWASGNTSAETRGDKGSTTLKELTGLRVLLVEDNAVNRFLATKILKNDGHVVASANNGLEALDKFARGRFDVILMDLQMPEMDGFEATREIRKRESADAGSGRTPIIALTANAMRGDRERCLAAEMDDHLTKPFVSAELRSALARATQLRR